MSLEEEPNLGDLQDTHDGIEDEEEELEEFNPDAVINDESPKKGKKKRDVGALRKAPQAPKRFKSSYICFFMAKQPEIKAELGADATVTAISKRSAEMWKDLSSEDRAHWDGVAAKDKQRYMVEKASYTGPWQVPWKRSRKDPSAPKRPMSAFLYFSQGKRSQLKQENPELKNTEVSRLLGEKWRNSTDEQRRPHVDKEKEEREIYKVAMAEWRKEKEVKDEAQRRTLSEMSTMPQPENPFGDAYGQSPHIATPYMYPGYNFPFPSGPGPYQFPTNGKQPVILGPNGTPHYPINYKNVAGTPPAGTTTTGVFAVPGGGYEEGSSINRPSTDQHFGFAAVDTEPPQTD